MSDAVTLRGMRFHALVGILEHEKHYAQPLEIDLTAWLASPVSAITAVELQVVDYRVLYDLVADEVSRAPIGYIEHLAATIADRALEDSRIARVDVTIRKPHVALPGPLDAAEVHVERGRRV